MDTNWQMPIGAQVTPKGVYFRVWAPKVRQLEVIIFEGDRETKKSFPLKKNSQGYFEGEIEGLKAGARFMYRLDGDALRPDPASRYQPLGVHGPSEVVDPAAFGWSEANANWPGIPLEQMVIYELHVGTATSAGTFEALIEKLDYFKELGVNTLELLPVADFPGDRNWGYDGVNLFAPARVYGGPDGLRRLVDAAHRRGLAVVQDVVYNHLGPDGNYLRDFSLDYFTDKEKTPWGDAINYQRPEVREFFLSNALYWTQEYRVDGLRLDATHAILDHSPEHILKELARRVRASLPAGRHFVIMAEDERNEVALIKSPENGGYGLDAVWADDFHHEVRVALAQEHEGYYADFTGKIEDLVETMRKGWFYAGQISTFSGKARGTDASQFEPPHFVYCIQNHDQVGNRALGDRLNHAVSGAAFRAASALLLLGPGTPLIFQGQEWAASAPFLFFTDHEAELGKLVTEGRRAEFAHFAAFSDSGQEVPDPQALATFENSKLNWDEIKQGEHAQMLAFYRDLLALRREAPLLRQRIRANITIKIIGDNIIAIRYQKPDTAEALLVLINLDPAMELALDRHELTLPPDGTRWEAALVSNDRKYGGQETLASLNEALTKGHIKIAGPVAIVLKTQA
jgi:maltooligosyltrehalose trehalohydrolase